MTTAQLAKTRKALADAARIIPLEEVRIRMQGGHFLNDNEAVSVIYRLSVDVENVTFIGINAADDEVIRCVNGSALALGMAKKAA